MPFPFGIASAVAILALLKLPAAPASSAGPCGSRTAAPSKITHVLVIVEENTSYSTALKLPYIHTLSSSCGLATNYHGVTHPSLGNYLAMTSGSIPRKVRGTDCSPSPGCRSNGRSIFGQTHGRWRVWAEHAGAVLAYDERALCGAPHCGSVLLPAPPILPAPPGRADGAPPRPGACAVRRQDGRPGSG